MYNYLYKGQYHENVDTDYLKKLGMDAESIEVLQQNANDFNKQLFSDYLLKRSKLLHEYDWMILRHMDQISLHITTSLTAKEYNSLLLWRQELRDMPDLPSDNEIVWPPLPSFLDDKLLDYSFNNQVKL